MPKNVFDVRDGSSYVATALNPAGDRLVFLSTEGEFRLGDDE